MARSKQINESKILRYGQLEISVGELIDAMYLDGQSLEFIAEVLNVDEKRFIAKYAKRLEHLKTVTDALVVSRLYQRAGAGEPRALERVLMKRGWINENEDESNKEFVVRIVNGNGLRVDDATE